MPGREFNCVAKTSGSLLILRGLSGGSSGVLEVPRSGLSTPIHSLTKCCVEKQFAIVKMCRQTTVTLTKSAGKKLNLFSFGVLLSTAACWGGRAAVGRASVRSMQRWRVRFRRRGHVSVMSLWQKRLQTVAGGTRRQVGAGADGACSPSLLSDVSAIPREAFSLLVTIHFCRLVTGLFFHNLKQRLKVRGIQNG